MDPFGAGAAIAPTGHIFSAHRAGKDGARIWMNVTAYQEKKNKETKTGKRRTGEKREKTDHRL